MTKDMTATCATMKSTSADAIAAGQKRVGKTSVAQAAEYDACSQRRPGRKLRAETGDHAVHLAQSGVNQHWMRIVWHVISAALLVALAPPAAAATPVDERLGRESEAACSTFHATLAENLDFEAAFNAAFVRDPKLRRERLLGFFNESASEGGRLSDRQIVDAYQTYWQLLVWDFAFHDFSDEGTPSEIGKALDAISKSRYRAHDALRLNANLPRWREAIAELRRKSPAAAQAFDQFRRGLLDKDDVTVDGGTLDVRGMSFQCKAAEDIDGRARLVELKLLWKLT